MLSLSFVLMYLNIHVISAVIYSIVRDRKTELPKEKTDELLSSLWGFKQGKYKDISEDQNTIILFPITNFSYLRKEGDKINVIEQNSGQKYCLSDMHPLFPCVKESFSRKIA